MNDPQLKATRQVVDAILEPVSGNLQDVQRRLLSRCGEQLSDAYNRIDTLERELLKHKLTAVWLAAYLESAGRDGGPIEPVSRDKWLKMATPPETP